MKKIHFELWWLWIPILIFTFPQITKGHTVIAGAAYSTLFALAIMGVFLRPRTPKVIYSHLNSMLRRVMWLMSTFTLALVWSAVGIAVLKVNVADWVIGMGIFAMLIVMGLTLVYLIYWSLPYSRKRSGIAAVDAAIERYRKPGEQVGGAWVAPVVIEGKRYYAVTYRSFINRQEVIEGLAFGENGVVVKNEELMQKIVQGNRLAWNISNPEQINMRTANYNNLKKYLFLIKKKVLPYWGQWEQAIGIAYVEEMKQIEQTFPVLMRYAEAMIERFYREAEWGMRHGNVRLREVPYEDVEKLNEQDKVFTLLAENVNVIRDGIKASRSLAKVLYENDKLRTQVKSLTYILEDIMGYEARVREIESYLARGEKELAYPGMGEPVKQSWISRLAWVDVVDGWVAQGYTGKALEAKKREYLAEQARLERQRKRKERAHKRAERAAQQKQKASRKETEG